MAPPAEAASTCFNGFGGTIHYNFAVAPTTFATPGTFSTPVVEFDKLSSCAGLKKWPIVGTVTVTATSVVLAFRALTVDAAGCGATDNIVGMSPRKLSGSLQLHNDRSDFSNTGTFVEASCVTPPPASADATAAPAAQGSDAQGN
jgi:hypothetical protein